MATTTLKKLSIAAAGAVLLALGVGKATPAAVITFDTLSPGEIVDNQYLDLGVDFNGNSSILTAGEGLDPSYPPLSGNNLIYNYPSDAIRIDAVGSFWDSAGAYITGIQKVKLTAYDSNNRILGTTSTGGSNYLNSGTGIAPNFFLSIIASDIAYVKFMAEDEFSGNSFTLDDFTFKPQIAACPAH